jgi:hypothetical protein
MHSALALNPNSRPFGATTLHSHVVADYVPPLLDYWRSYRAGSPARSAHWKTADAPGLGVRADNVDAYTDLLQAQAVPLSVRREPPVLANNPALGQGASWSLLPGRACSRGDEGVSGWRTGAGPVGSR